MPDRRIDGPDEVAFIKEITKHIPGAKESQEIGRRIMYDTFAATAGIALLRKVKKNASKPK